MSIERVAFVAHPAKPEASTMLVELTSWLAERGIDTSDEDPDLVISLGGDGTMLRAAADAHRSDALLLGVNFGALGFLTEVEAGQEHVALEKVIGGSFEVEERMMLECEVFGDGLDQRHVGLNEILVERSDRYRLVRLRVKVNEESLTVFNADGVMVATPTGSTAYALSAGGPIISPRAEALEIVPVSPHMIFSRPFVLAPDDEVTIEIEDAAVVASLSLDGHLGCPLEPGARVVVRRHPRPLRLVRLAGPDFLQRLRTKLKLPE